MHVIVRIEYTDMLINSRTQGDIYLIVNAYTMYINCYFLMFKEFNSSNQNRFGELYNTIALNQVK